MTVQQIVQQAKVVEELIFIATTKKLTQIYLRISCDIIRLKRIIIVSPDPDIPVMSFYLSVTNLQKQTARDVLRKSCSENMQQIYRETPMLKCDFNKVA